MSQSYQPTCDLAVLKARAELYQRIRQFFAAREVLEVETPVIAGRCNRCSFGICCG